MNKESGKQVMDKIWEGRFSSDRSREADDFNSSIGFDCKMYKQDISGSVAHAMMLNLQGIISDDDTRSIVDGLNGILNDIEAGKLIFDPECEDIHTFIERELTDRIGEAGKKLHTARSRNDQVAVDIRLYLKDEINEIISLIKDLLCAVYKQASEHKDTIMPGYTHLQRAQPVTFGHHLLAYAMMLMRDVSRLEDALARMNESPLGSCALAGTTYNTDRYYEAELLCFEGITINSIDGVSDRDFCVEILSACSLIMMHLSRFAEELILWSSWEFKFIELDEAFTTGSSIMPQKKNSDMAELVRGKTGRVYGDLMGLLTVLKGLPLAYNKDMQEDKEAVFDGIETVKKCLKVFAPMVETMKPIPENMYNAAKQGFLNATDLADYLVKKGMPFRTAYKTVGTIVGECVKTGKTLDTVTIAEYKEYSDLFEDDLYEEISLETCVKKRISAGGTGHESVSYQLEQVRKFLDEH